MNKKLAILCLSLIFLSPIFSTQVPVAETGEPMATEVEHTEEKSEEKFNVTGMIAHHLNDAPVYHLEIKGIDLSITKRVVMMWIAALLLILILVTAARKITKRGASKPSRFTGFIEVFVNFIRVDVSAGSMGAKHAKNYDPYLLTLFFFVLACNLLGLFPPLGELAQIVGEQTGLIAAHTPTGPDDHSVPLLIALWPAITPTGDVNVNLVLAAFTLFLIFIAGFANQGILFPYYVVPKGIHWALQPLMWVIEFASLFIKSGVLAVRLLANMTAGHVIILVLMSFIISTGKVWMPAVSVLSSTLIFMLELFVAFLQAYIFTFLTALFIASAQHRH